MRNKYTAIHLITDALAVFRLTKLMTDDYITEDIRNYIFDHTKQGSKLRYFITCGWCTSMWAAIALVSLRRIHEPTANIISTSLALSAITGVSYDKGL